MASLGVTLFRRRGCFSHMRWMIRSVAIVLSSLRIRHILFFLSGLCFRVSCRILCKNDSRYKRLLERCRTGAYPGLAERDCVAYRSIRSYFTIPPTCRCRNCTCARNGIPIGLETRADFSESRRLQVFDI